MPTSQLDIDQVKIARKKQSSAIQAANKLSTGAMTFKDRVMEQVRSARADRGIDSLTQDLGNASGQVLSAPANIRERTSNVNPLAVDAITARQRGQTLGNLASMSQAEQRQTGSVEDIIGAGTNQILALAENKKAEAAMAAQEADDIIKMIQLKQQQEQFELDRRIKLSQLNSAGPSNVLVQLLSQSGTPGSAPQMSAVEGTVSPDGQWIMKNGQWSQVGGGSMLDRLSVSDLENAMISDPSNRILYENLLERKESSEGYRGVELGVSGQNKMNLLRDIFNAAQTAMSLHDNSFTGFGDSIAGKIRGFLGNPKENEVEFQQSIAQIRTAIRNAISGAAISKQEGKEIENLLPSLIRGDRTVLDGLSATQRRILQQIQNVLDTAGYQNISASEYISTPYGQGGNSTLDSIYGY